MARLAGDSGYYEFAPLDGAGNPKGRSFKLPSVTTILEALPKYLQWWGYELGLAQALQMFVDGKDLGTFTRETLYEEAKRLGREEDGITPITVLNEAAGRGTDVHEIAETMFKEGRFPTDVPESQQGYVRALRDWWQQYLNSEASVEVLSVEECVYSILHGYAGTVDLILRWTTAGDEWYEVIDFKTSKDIYESHLIQSTAYAEAAVEMGIVPLDAHVTGKVVCFRPTGKFKEQESECTLDDFLTVKKQWELLCRLNPDKMLHKERKVKKPAALDR